MSHYVAPIVPVARHFFNVSPRTFHRRLSGGILSFPPMPERREWWWEKFTIKRCKWERFIGAGCFKYDCLCVTQFMRTRWGGHRNHVWIEHQLDHSLIRVGWNQTYHDEHNIATSIPRPWSLSHQDSLLQSWLSFLFPDHCAQRFLVASPFTNAEDRMGLTRGNIQNCWLADTYFFYRAYSILFKRRYLKCSIS